MADIEMGHTSERIAENVVLLAWARVSMALALPAIGLIFTLGWAYIDKQFDDMNGKLTDASEMATTASDKATKVNDRLIAVETKQERDALSSEKFQTATLARLDNVQSSLIQLSNSVSALTATLKTVVEDQRQPRR